MRSALDSAGHRVPRTKPTCLLHTWRPHRRRPFVLVLHLHQHESSCNLHLQYIAKNQSTQRCQSLVTLGSDHPPVLEPHMVLSFSHAGHMIFLPQTRELRQSKKHVRLMPLVVGYVPWTYSSNDLHGSSDPSRGHAGATNL
jgi:hypothetical protein